MLLFESQSSRQRSAWRSSQHLQFPQTFDHLRPLVRDRANPPTVILYDYRPLAPTPLAIAQLATKPVAAPAELNTLVRAAPEEAGLFQCSEITHEFDQE